MKHQFTIYDLRFTIWKKSVKFAAANRQSVSRPASRACGIGNPNSELRIPNSQNGVALIITLILLSVVTFMAITFLALSRRERSAVSTVTDTASARLAADAALANAEARVIANVLSTTNPYNFSLLVSTNGWPVTFTNLPGDLTNLYVSPRAPVYLSNIVTHVVENRFYLDLNRNGQFDTNGFVLVTNFFGQVGTNYEVGDPEWIGVLERPDAPYGPNNKFIARYAFIAVPVGNALDLNAIHNQAMTGAVNPSPVTHVSDGFLRNQGVGSWEINLAAFLTDLDPNQWDTISDSYNYLQPNNGNTGRGFEDALSLLSYRYGFNYNSLTNAAALLNGAPGFGNDNIDGYSDGPLQTGFQLPVDNDNANNLWAGADNTNHFFAPEELFNPNETSPLFVNSLLAAGNTNSIYEHYTFYRLLSQLGTDSTPESGKMNLNYSNAVVQYDNNGAVTNIAIVPGAETNFVPWRPLDFFNVAADRLLRAYTTQWRNSNPTNFATTFYTVTNFNFVNSDQWTNYPAFGVTNIPVLVSNQFVYSPAVNRLLQLAANIYDATTNRTDLTTYPYLPSVFRPIFNKAVTLTTTSVFICGFIEVTNAYQADMPLSVPYNLANSNDLAQLRTTGPNYINVFGVPMIIGAKKGFPNFNEFYMESTFQITRKLKVTRTVTNLTFNLHPDNFHFYEKFNLSLSNHFGVECWNSYRSNYTRPIDIYVTNFLVMTLTNDENNFSYPTNLIAGGSLPLSYNSNPVWQGYTNSYPFYLDANSFPIPLQTNFTAVQVSMYRFNGGLPFLATNLYLDFETNVPVFNGINTTLPQPHWGLVMNNNLQVIMVDHNTGRLIDYVQLIGPNSTNDLSTEIQTNYDTVGLGSNTGYNDQWDPTINPNDIPAGIQNQISVSQGSGNPIYSAALWGMAERSAYDQMNGLHIFLNGPGSFVLTYSGYPGFSPAQIGIAGTTNTMDAAYTPSALVVQDIVWQVNDPLVHYMASDLINPTAGNRSQVNLKWPGNLGKLNLQRFEPWVGNPSTVGTNMLAIKDPLVTCSDDWSFPTNKFPTIGWLGRVHRGTPWQTIFLKSPDVLSYQTNFGVYGNNGTNVWVNWTGNLNLYDATNAAPVKDWLLFDLFTTAFNDNATRGTLSVNVGPTNANLAAWSALFSGIAVPTSLTNSPPTIISPAGTLGAGSPLWQLVANINTTRANFTNADGLVGTFEHVGDILAAPALTEQSPFLAGLNPNTQINDEMYEWLPQQTMSLLRCSSSPRYVIYCYGQALKPAPNGIYTGSGQFFGMVTNYQVVSEIATRAVVRFGSVLTNPPPTLIITSTNSYWIATPPVVTNNNAVIESFNLLPPD